MLERWDSTWLDGRRLDRRRLLAAAAAAAAGGSALSLGRVRAADAPPETPDGSTRAGQWLAAERLGLRAAQTVEGVAPDADPVRFAADFPFVAIAPRWSEEVAPGAWVELRLSPDGETWSEPVTVGEAAHGGRPDQPDRRFGHLVFHPGATFVQYQAYDPEGRPATLPGLGFDYLDASPGPTLATAAQEVPLPPPPPASPAPPPPPPVIPRAAWGADEGYRFSAFGEIWPVAYAPVEHVIIHHTETANFEDPLVAIRSVYYFHTVTRGWGDIGYNYLIDFLGNIYEGRVGGESVVAGHARFYNEGSVGIGLLGNYGARTITPETRAALLWLTAYVGRNLDPFGSAPFQDIPSLPTICAHRDVNPTACPGDAFYDELPSVRDAVAGILATGQVPAQPAPAFAPGQLVTTAAEGSALRDRPGLGGTVVVPMRLSEPLTVGAGPATVDGVAWYAVRGRDLGGWVSADLLAPDPALAAAPPAADPGAESPESVASAADASPGPVADSGEAVPPAPLAVGDLVLVVGDAVNLHDGPGLAAPILGALPEGSLATVLAGPTPTDGRDWYRLDPGTGERPAWAAGEFLSPV